MATTARQLAAMARPASRRPCPVIATALPTHPPCARSASRRRGGEHRATAHRLQRRIMPRLTHVVELLESALDDAYAGRPAPRNAEAVTTVARALMAAIEIG